MSRTHCLLAWGIVLAASGLAHGQRDVRSFHARGSTSGPVALVVIPSIPDGFVLTDIYASRNDSTGSVWFSLNESDGATISDLPFSVNVGSSEYYETHLSSGIRLTPGRTLGAAFEAVVFPDVAVTLAGYIETQPALGSAPAVGNVGMGVLVLTVIVAGGLVLRRRVAA